MLHSGDWGEHLLAAGAICPVPGCGSLVIAYASKPIKETRPDWIFRCPHCEFEFSTVENERLFHSVPISWLRAGMSRA
jgi:hypothetical protein